MRHLKLLGLTLTVLFILNIATTTTAFALPDISVTLEDASYPLDLEVSLLTLETQLLNVVKENLHGVGLLLLYLLTALGTSGTYEALYTKATSKSGTACFSEEGGKKDQSEEVLTKGTWHLVYTSLTGSTQGLQLGILYLLSPVEVVCGTEIIKVKGDGIGSVQTLPGSEATQYTSLTTVLKGNEAGSPNIHFFYNDAEASVKAKLEANFGSGFKEAFWEYAEPVTVPTLECKMFVVTSR
jgi:hypothetical protein